MFLGTSNKVYILDKTENNPVNVTGLYGTHPAWAVEYDIDSNECELFRYVTPRICVETRPDDGRRFKYLLCRWFGFRKRDVGSVWG